MDVILIAGHKLYRVIKRYNDDNTRAEFKLVTIHMQFRYLTQSYKFREELFIFENSFCHVNLFDVLSKFS